MKNKKILIVLKYASFYSYCESIIKELEKENDLILCIQQENKINSIRYCIDTSLNLLFQKNINNDEILNLVDGSRNIKIVEGINRKGKWVKILRNIRETLNYLSFLLRGDENTFSKVQSKYISNKIIRLIKLLKFKPLLKVLFLLLKLINNIIPTDKGINSFIKNINPDIVLIVGANWPTRNKQLSSEIDFIKSSNKLNKLSILHVISWDNLIARGLYHYKPSLFFVWNRKHFDEAVEIHKMPKKIVKIIGAPLMDKWFNDIKIKPKNLFFNSIGLDADKPLVTYLGSARNISKNEKIIVEEIYSKLNQKGIQLIVRPHGANTDQFENLNHEIKMIPQRGELPDTDISKELMVETIRYSDFTVGINTTAMIDSIILGTPTIAIIKEEYNQNQILTPHFNKVLQEGIFINISDEKNILKKISEFNGKEKKFITIKMNEFVKNFCRPYGLNISAGKKAYDEINLLINNQFGKD
tara:strand:- start:3683 stop:5095 length:1413 start_codon:yes stop_codon:yes gene_type:complete